MTTDQRRVSLMSNLHAHIESYAIDCDGPISRDYILTMNDDELAGQDQPHYFGDLDFHERVLANVVHTYSSFRGGRLNVETDDDYGNVSLEYTEPTEEGFRSTTARFCTDDCNTTMHGYRDHRAESMGY